MTDKEAMKLALEALQANQPVNYCVNNNGEKFPMFSNDPMRQERNEKATTALKERLAQLEQGEPVAWKLNVDVNNYQGQSEYRTILAFRPDPAVIGNYEVNEVISAQRLYTTPQQRTWVGLSDEDLKLLSAEWRIVYGAWMDNFTRDIEAKLKEKNT
jgi:hypothetical protein